MTTLDALSLRNWESIADWGTLFVIIGVAGEGVELVVKCLESTLEKKRKWRHFFHKADPWINLVGGTFWIMVVLGLCAEFKGNHMAKLILDKDNAELHHLASMANERAESEKLARVKIEERLAGWTLNPGGDQRLIEHLKPFGGTRYVLAVNPAAYNFLNTLDAILQSSGWNRKLPCEQGDVQILLDGKASVSSMEGIFIDMPVGRTDLISAGAALYNELRLEGIPAKGNIFTNPLPPNMECMTNAIQILIGKRP